MLSRDPLELDREVHKAAQHWQRARRSLRTDASAEFLFSPRLRSEELNQELEEAPAYDPLARPLRVWLHRLHSDHATWRARVELQKAWHVAEHPLNTPLLGLHTRQKMLFGALTEPRRRSDWIRAFMEHADELSARALRFWEARQEFAAEQRLASFDALNEVATPAAAAAEHWLGQTRDLFDPDFRSADLAAYLANVLAAERSDGWPAKVSPQALKELLSEADWFRGLAIDAGRLPLTLGASSFLRALARLGAAIFDAAATPRQPFVIAHEAYGLGRRSFGALFGMLPHNAAFAQRRLGLGGSRKQAHLRSMASLLLHESRALALRLRLRSALFEGKRALLGIFPEITADVLGFSLPGEAALTLIRVRSDDPQRFAGLMLAARRSEELVETHDEDWFRNPRAIEELRAEAEAVPRASTSTEALMLGCDALLRALRASL